jgi:ankyrin repeat protein
MKTKLCIGIFLLAAAWLHAQTNDLTALLQQGLFEEQANRNLDAAIADYSSLAAHFEKDRQLAATAVFRLGECYRAQGRTNEAAEQYGRIVRDFPDQQTLATLSRQDLAGMGMSGPQTPAVETVAAESSDAKLWNQLKDKPRDELGKILPTLIPDAVLDDLLKKRNEAQSQRASLVVDYSTNNPTVARVDALLAELNRQIGERISGMMEALELRAEFPQARLQTPLQSIAGQNSAGSGAGATDEEDREIQRIQQMIQSSPDLINAPSDGSTPLGKAAYNGWLKVAAYLLDHGADINVASPDVRWTKELNQVGPVTPLMAAVIVGNKAMTKFLIDRGADINCKGQHGDTPLHLAARNGFLSVAEVLLASHAEINARNASGATPLFSAVEHRQSKIVQWLLANGADANLTDNDRGWPVLTYAVEYQQDILKVLLDAGTNPNMEDSEGRTPLSRLVEQGGNCSENVKLLLAAKADPNGGKLDAPLLGAVHNNDVGTAELLLQAGANPNAKGAINWDVVIGGNRYSGDNMRSRPFGDNMRPVTPLYLAVSLNQLSMVQLLLKYKADPNDAQTDGQSLLFSALSYSNILAGLLEAGGRADARQASGETLLESAVYSKNFAAVPLLLKFKADPNYPEFAGGVSILFAALSDTNTLEALLDAGAKIDAVSKDGNNWTPLGDAIWENNAAAVEILLKHGANPNVRNSNGFTPLHWAAWRQADRRIFELLLAYKADPNVRSNNGKTPLAELKEKLESTSVSPEQKISLEQFADLLRQHGALDELPDWDAIKMARTSAKFSFAIFHKGTNDWNQFTLLEALANFYFSSQNYQVPQGDNTWAGYPLPAMLRFPDLTRIVIVRPSRGSTNETRISVNLLNQTNGIDCAKDLPLAFGDVVEVAERDHTLGDNEDGLTGGQKEALGNYVKGIVRLKVQAQQVELPCYRLGDQATLGTLLNNSEARKLLLASSDLARVKVIRRDPKSGENHEWILDCSSPETSNNNNNRDFVPRRRSIPGGSNGNNFPFANAPSENAPSENAFWLRDGDVIEVPEKPSP